MINDILFYIVILLTNIIQCITGFAGTVLAMPFSIMLVGYSVAKPTLNVFGILSSAGVIAPLYKQINVKEFLKMSGIMLAGIIAAAFIPSDFFHDEKGIAYKILGVLVIALAVWNAIRFYSKKDNKDVNPVVATIILILSGVVHGIYVCGGPLLVTYASAKLKDKQEFRATLSATWIVLNTAIFIEDLFVYKYFTPEVWIYTGIGAVILFAAIFIGNKLAKRMSRNLFLQLTYLLMIISGISLLLK